MVVTEYLQEEVHLERVIGSLAEEIITHEIHISPFKVILKCSQPGKWS